MSKPSASLLSQLEADATSAGFVCGRCGYDVRRLAADAPCTECGAPAEQRRRVSLLASANLHWLRQLALGLLLIAIGRGAWDVITQLFVWDALVTGRVSQEYVSVHTITGRLMPDLLAALPSLVMLAGVLLFTARPPTFAPVDVGARWRVGGRVLMIVRACVLLLIYLLHFGEVWLNRHVVPAPYVFWSRLLPDWVTNIWEALGLAVIVALCIYTYRLARLGGKRWLPRLAVLTIAISLIAHYALWVDEIEQNLPSVFEALKTMSMLFSTEPSNHVLIILFGLQGLCIVVGSLWFAVVLCRDSG